MARTGDLPYYCAGRIRTSAGARVSARPRRRQPDCRPRRVHTRPAYDDLVDVAVPSSLRHRPVRQLPAALRRAAVPGGPADFTGTETVPAADAPPCVPPGRRPVLRLARGGQHALAEGPHQFRAHLRRVGRRDRRPRRRAGQRGGRAAGQRGGQQRGVRLVLRVRLRDSRCAARAARRPSAAAANSPGPWPDARRTAPAEYTGSRICFAVPQPCEGRCWNRPSESRSPCWMLRSAGLLQRGRQRDRHRTLRHAAGGADRGDRRRVRRLLRT